MALTNFRGVTRSRIEFLRDTYRDGLIGDTIPFWFPRCVDQEQGGFWTAFDRDGTLIDDDKGVWQQGRCTWLLGELYNQCERREQWLQWARQGAAFIEQFCIDATDNRMWFHVTRSGTPLRKRRYAYSEAFAAIAMGELYQATGEERYRTLAWSLFERYLGVMRGHLPTVPKFTGHRPTKSIGVPMIAIVTARQLLDSTGLESASNTIMASIDEIRRDFVKPELQCVMETVGMGGEVIDHFDGRTLNPGHAIEAAWFLLWEGKVRGDATLVQLGCQMLDWMWQRGWDEEHGGLFYFRDLEDKPVQEYWHDMKFWWPHNETIIATLLAHELTGDPKYARWHTLVHDWSYERFPDSEFG
ncbi:MAG: AGE family epimerase/isomerase, partial [Planctomycetales bacterium]|nr:AGE family epimerase/isomerase [Planctomycetales bacterium]